MSTPHYTGSWIAQQHFNTRLVGNKMTVQLLILSVLWFSEASSVVSDRYTRTENYEGEIVAKCTYLKQEALQQLLDAPSVDIWKRNADGSLDIRMNRKLYDKLGLSECTVAHESVEKLVVEFEEMLSRTNVEWFQSYHTYEEIVNWYKKLADDNRNVKYVSSIGKSVEGRDQPAVHIGRSDAKYKIYFQCQIHAREWISGAVCMYVANYLAKSTDVIVHMDDVEFIFVPCVNPDGYVYSWTTNRLWRKNRRINPGSTCRGVDLNRNYPIRWATGGTSSDPCTEIYHGSSAASEPEIQNTIKYFQSVGNIIGAIDWHSYTQLILRPHGWTMSNIPDEAQLKKLGDRMREKIKDVHGKTYTNMKAVELYPATGTALDWFYSDDANSNNAYRAAGYVIELRDTGQYGFLLPPSQIIPNGEEIVPAVLDFAQYLKKYPLDKYQQ